MTINFKPRSRLSSSLHSNTNNHIHIREIMMRPINSTSEVTVWKSPVPYLFGGLALMLALISVALVILVCSHRKRASQSSSSSQELQEEEEEEEEGGFRLRVMAMADSQPKILVIMAGDDKPSYLAQPIVPLSYCSCQPEPSPSSSTSICNTDQKISH